MEKLYYNVKNKNDEYNIEVYFCLVSLTPTVSSILLA